MISIRCDHPDIEEFIDIKNDLTKVTKANISIRVTDEFMKKASKGESIDLEFNGVVAKSVNARDLLHRIAKNNHAMAEPGMLFWDKIRSWHLLSEDSEFGHAGVNPCVVGSTLVQTTEGVIPIRDLVGKTPTVLAYDTTTNKIVNIVASKVWLTRENANVVEVIVSDSETDTEKALKCTPEHRLLTKRGYVEAQDLTMDDYVLVRNSEGSIVECKVLDVICLEIQEDVYDMTVPEVHNFIANDMVIHNCAEEPLPPGGSCLLSSANLAEMVINPYQAGKSYFDFDMLDRVIRHAVIYMNDILDEGLELHPLEEQRESVRKWRQIGIGIMGFGDALLKLGVKYSADAVPLIHKIGSTMINAALQQSALLAKEFGPYPAYKESAVFSSHFFNFVATPETRALVKKYGLRNSQLLTIAPTGSISSMLGVSGGIEAIFAKSYTRKTETLHDEETYYTIFTPIIKEIMDVLNITKEDDLPEYVVTAHDIPYRDRILVQSAWQLYIDAAISSTVNVKEEFTVEDTEKLYLLAWEMGCKGITMYRDNCERPGILQLESKESKEVISDPIEVEEPLLECPECGTAINHSGGCISCPHCGWGKCNL